VGYLAASLYEALERPGSWEADGMLSLFDEGPFKPPDRTGSTLTARVLNTIEFDIAEIVHRKLAHFALTIGGGADGVTALLEHVVMVVCNGMDGPADCTLRLFGKWPQPREIWCPQCHAAVFDERDLIVFPEGNLCPKCLPNHTCSSCGKRLTETEAAAIECDGAWCDACRAARDAADAAN